MLRLDLMDLVEHHLVGGHHQALVIKETGHVREGRDDGLVLPDDIPVEIGRYADDAVDFLAGHQILRLRHADAVVGDPAFPAGTHFPDIAPAVFALGKIHHGHGHLVHHPVPVHPAVEQRIDQSGEAEDQHHAAVRPDQFQFIGQNAQTVAEPAARIAYSILFHRS